VAIREVHIKRGGQRECIQTVEQVGRVIRFTNGWNLRWGQEGEERRTSTKTLLDTGKEFGGKWVLNHSGACREGTVGLAKSQALRWGNVRH